MHSYDGAVHPRRLSSIGRCGGSRGDMNKNVVAAAVFLMCAGTAHGADKEKEPSAILEIGGASEWSLQNGGASVGPSIAVEVEPIKEWLELEAGFSPLLKKGSSPEWSTDLLFKKPFTLSNSVEFMIGAGRRVRNGHIRTAAAKSPPNSRSISCSGPHPIASSVGSWNRLTATRSARGMNRQRLSAWGCSYLFHDLKEG
jgi:hypothetical protein